MADFSIPARSLTGQAPDTHRNWLIEQNYLHHYEATHPGYDGPEDSRHVTGKTRDEVVAEIDEWCDEHGEDA